MGVRHMSKYLLTLDIAPLYGPTPLQKRSGTARVFKDYTVFPATHAFIHEWNEPYLPLPFQPKLVIIYRLRKDGRMSYLLTYLFTHLLDLNPSGRQQNTGLI